MTQSNTSASGAEGCLRLMRRLRQNHALEHATMHILSAQLPRRTLVGRSTPGGIYIYGDAPTDLVIESASEGLRRLKAGQRELAVHPNCGTGLVLAGVLAGLGAFAILGRRTRSVWERLLLLPLACAAATLGIVVARPLGPLVQSRISTDANVRGTRIAGAQLSERAGIRRHFIRTES
jgi:hypothetical protein